MSRVNEKIEELTLEILKRNDLLKIPTDIAVIADRSKIKVYDIDLSTRMLGAINYDAKGDFFQIALNEKLPLTQKRMTLAHELGHFFLHQDELRIHGMHVEFMYKLSEDTEEEKEKEREAEYFAGALLMNRFLLEKTYEKIKDIKELSELFEVSESDMTIRMGLLGLI